MSYLELFLMALSLSFDTFAVSLAGGMGLKEKPSVLMALKIFLFFALFQTGFTAIGWMAGRWVMNYICAFDHWVVFVLLSYIGGMMVRDGVLELRGGAPKEQKYSLLKTGHLILLSIATSIDAVAVGVSLALIDIAYTKIVFGFSMIFATTFLASFAGLSGGRMIGGGKFSAKAEIVGGVILFGIGLKILLEHMFGA